MTVRTLKRREFIKLTAGGATFIAIAACTPTTGPGASPSGGTAASPAAKFGGEAVVAIGNEPSTLLSYQNGTAVGGYILTWIANGMTKLQLPEMSAAPDLAESWTVSPDGKTYAFKIRKGVKWHDGVAFELDDIKFTMQVLANPDRAGALGAGLANVVGGTAFKNKTATEISGITISGDTITFQLLAPNATFLTTTAAAVILPKHVLKDVPVADLPKHAFGSKPIYTGAYKVDSFKTGEGVTVSAFTDHFAGRPRLDKIVARGLPESATALAELRTGGVLAANVPADQISEFEKDTANYSVRTLAGTTIWYFQFDLTNPLFADKRVRQAISHSVDRQSIVNTIFSGKGEVGTSMASPLSWVHNPQAPTYPFDLNKAKALLDDAGWKAGADGIRVKDGKRLEFTVSHTPARAAWVLATQPMLKNAGINMKTEQMEFGALQTKLVVGKYEAGFNGWGNFSIDPRSDLQAHFRSPRTPDSSGYKNDAVDKLFTDAQSMTVRADEKKAYDQIQAQVEADPPYVYLWRIAEIIVIRKPLVVPQAKLASELWSNAPQWERST